jgi:rhodanese-related sulfurtransferase
MIGSKISILTVFLHCAGGYRSMIAASILQARGFRNFKEIEGGLTLLPKQNYLKLILYVKKIL